MPKVTAVSVDKGKNSPGNASGADGEVMLDIEVSAAVAPGAKIVVYFAPNTDQGFYRRRRQRGARYDQQPERDLDQLGGPGIQLDCAGDGLRSTPLASPPPRSGLPSPSPQVTTARPTELRAITSTSLPPALTCLPVEEPNWLAAAAPSRRRWCGTSRQAARARPEAE